MVGEKKLQKQKTRKIQKTMSKEDQAAKNKQKRDLLKEQADLKKQQKESKLNQKNWT
jgi:hypothetical protein